VHRICRPRSGVGPAGRRPPATALGALVTPKADDFDRAGATAPGRPVLYVGTCALVGIGAGRKRMVIHQGTPRREPATTSRTSVLGAVGSVLSRRVEKVSGDDFRIGRRDRSAVNGLPSAGTTSGYSPIGRSGNRDEAGDEIHDRDKRLRRSPGSIRIGRTSCGARLLTSMTPRSQPAAR